MRTFKSISAIAVNRRLGSPGSPLWQRNYYEHIIRDERELQAIREYIRYNPLKWEEDEENPNLKRTGRFESPPLHKYNDKRLCRNKK
jgi:putative transposase